MTVEPRCLVCGQEEGPFPGVREAVRVLGAHGWLRRPAAEAWRGGYWAAGYPHSWYCTHHADAWVRAVRALTSG